jgi:hypothetical protein
MRIRPNKQLDICDRSRASNQVGGMNQVFQVAEHNKRHTNRVIELRCFEDVLESSSDLWPALQESILDFLARRCDHSLSQLLQMIPYAH